MADLFVLALLGHLVGDYLLQTKHMALQKSAPGWSGVLTCTFHVAVYTAAVCAFWWTINPVVMALVFVPHWIIDRWSLASPWLKMIRGRTFEAAFNSKDPYREFDIAFTSIVYTVTDNAMHLICLWLVIRFWML
jgi:Protein of unknown function (DUF3307)